MTAPVEAVAVPYIDSGRRVPLTGWTIPRAGETALLEAMSMQAGLNLDDVIDGLSMPFTVGGGWPVGVAHAAAFGAMPGEVFEIVQMDERLSGGWGDESKALGVLLEAALGPVQAVPGIALHLHRQFGRRERPAKNIPLAARYIEARGSLSALLRIQREA